MIKGRHSEPTLDPVRDHQRIVQRLVCYDFPFDTTRALEFALFRTYCVPSISGLLDRTGEFVRCPQKRYDDTDIIVSELMEWGYDSARGAAALERMNRIHGHFKISNQDFLYVLSTFVFEPIRWNARFGWRRMTEIERLAFFHFWCAVGARMGVHGVPADYAEFERFNIETERARFAYADTNARIGNATRELFASWFPAWLRPLVRRVIHAMLDEPVRAAFGFPRPAPGLRTLVAVGMRLRARILRLLPKRRTPRLRTLLPHPTYPAGYQIEDIGPAWLTTAPAEQCTRHE